jgi:UDP-4-amino-4,6-dideoxy-N-acetyl-beta-L-altrosamine transaminase
MHKIPYGKQTIEQSDIDAVIDVLKSEFLTQGPNVPIFEQSIATYHGAKYGVAFANGTAALHGAYFAMGVGDGDEVVTSPNTFVATTNAALYCGARPAFVDIDPTTYCIDVTKIEDSINDNTKVIAPVAFGGYPVDLKAIREIADRTNCFVLYDAAHAIASKRDGSFGMEYVDMAMLSFHPVKHIATGEGGMILTNNPDYYEKLLLFRSHGITKNKNLLLENHGPWYYEMQCLGYNYRMTEMQAALGISQFKRIEENILSRNRAAKFYGSKLKECKGIELPPEIGFEVVGNSLASNIHAYHLYPIIVSNPNLREPLYNYLHENNILAQIHYIPVHLQPYYRDKYGYESGDFPLSEAYYDREISIPMFHNISVEELQFVVDKICGFMEAHS